MIRVVAIRPRDRGEWGERIRDVEALADYPLGADRFSIDHGSDYFAFFDRLGDARFWAAVEGERLLAVGCGVLRRVGRRRAWYGCDLKVHPDARGRHLPLRMLTRAFLPVLARCPRGYGISMDSPGKANRVARLARRFRFARIDAASRLLLWSLDAEAMRGVAPIVARHRGPLGYLSLAGIKDIVLASTGRPMPLLHVQFGPCAAPGLATPSEGHVHMFCSPADDPLARDVLAAGHEPSATATVLAWRMPPDFSWVLTSEI